VRRERREGMERERKKNQEEKEGSFSQIYTSGYTTDPCFLNLKKLHKCLLVVDFLDIIVSQQSEI